MNEFASFDVVSIEIAPLLSLFALQPVGSVVVSARSVRASEVVSYEPVASYEHAGSPHARMTLRSGDVLYVKQHVNTVAERLRSCTGADGMNVLAGSWPASDPATKGSGDIS